MDINPLVTPNDTLCNALNATIITKNGNENVLQNDMGNGRVETAYLPDGYVPIGTTEFGGIVYIVSYNPLIDKCQIGCFPSPERNITTDNVFESVLVGDSLFRTNGKIISQILKVKLLNIDGDHSIKLNPGDKYSIYSTNNGISGNAELISDVNNPLHIIDTDPKNVTIHVVSIGEDGKIVYLDDSLVWTGNDGVPLNYYIREPKPNLTENILQDLDSYKTLVSSAYNVFQSRVSGELALLFELKLIDTFSMTWDASVTDTDNILYDKKATIWFNINYTSKHANINPNYILLTLSECNPAYVRQPSEFLTILPGSLIYCDISNKVLNRKNDGTDSSIKIIVGDFKYSSMLLKNSIWRYTIMPAMKFGYMDYLSRSGSINFLEIGSGSITVDEWRYFIGDNTFNINWGLSAYPEKNKEIKLVVMTFIPFEEILKDDFKLKSENEVYTKYPYYTIQSKAGYSGYFLELLNFGNTSEILNGSILKNYLYLVDICIYYGDKAANIFKHNYKWLYTTGLYNDVYILNLEKLFDNLYLDNSISIKSSIEYQDNVNLLTSIITPSIELKKELDISNLPYELMTSKMTLVNYDNDKFNSSNSSFKGKVSTDLLKYTELFSLLLLENDTYEFTLSDKLIVIDDVQPTLDKDSSISNYVLPKVKLSIDSLDEEITTTILSIKNNNIGNSSIDNKAIDLFQATLLTDNNEFNINLLGVIFSRINADLELKDIVASLVIKPLLCYLSDYLKLGLSSYYSFYKHYTISHGDAGQGDPFYFEVKRLSSFAGETEARYNSHEAGWNPGDSFNKTNWWDDNPAYTNGLNVYMMEIPGPFKVVSYSSSDSVFYGGTKINGKFLLWAKTDMGHHIPINCFYGSTNIPGSGLELLISLLFLQIYYVDDSPVIILRPSVTNINYITNYNETWEFTLGSNLYISNLSNSIFIKKNNEDSISLSQLQEKASTLELNTNNISFETQNKNVLIDDVKMSHKFFILNNTLYNVYNDFKTDNVPALLYLSSNIDPLISLSKSPNSLYIYDNLSNLLVVLNLNSSTNLYLSGTIQNFGDRVIATNLNTSSGVNGVFNSFVYLNGELVLKEDLLTKTKVLMLFQTSALGNPKSIISNNSGYGLGRLAI